MRFSAKFLMVISLLMPLPCFAQFVNPANVPTPNEANAKPTIRNTYAGGQDEDDLKVQHQLIEPTALLDRRTLNQKVLKQLNNESGGGNSRRN